ncbi:unnamed protein product, partial [Allacma fusca]
MLTKWAVGWKASDSPEPAIPISDLSLQQRVVLDQVKQ